MVLDSEGGALQRVAVQEPHTVELVYKVWGEAQEGVEGLEAGL